MIPGSASPFFLGSSLAVGGGGAGYQISRSLRFNSSDSAYLSRTPGTAGNRRTWTWAGWVKRSGSGSRMDVLSTNTATSGNYLSLQFTSSNAISLGYYNGEIFTTSAVYRDFSAWMHVVLTLDTTLATATDRVKLYVNGSRITTFSTDNISSVLTQNSDQGINAIQSHSIGRNDNGANVHFDGYLAECYLIDGQALDYSSFTEVSATTGQLIPKTYTGTFGTNGFWLKFSDNSAATAAALGNDYSGNNNDWTPNNLSVTAGAGNDSLVDTPTSYGTPDTGVGNEVRGNYATLNPLLGSGTKSDGNLVTTTPNTYSPDVSTIAPSSGKWYAEIQWTSGTYARIGIQNATVTSSDFGGDAYGWRYESNSGTLTGPSTSTSGSTYSAGDIIGIAFDCDTGKLWVSKNNTWQNSGNPAAGTNASATNLPIGTPLAVAMATGTGASVFTANFGQRAFAYTAPSGFKALCDTNLGAPVVAKPNTLMDAVLYTGTGANQTISSLGFGPDLVWIKRRDSGNSHRLFDAVRGAQKHLTSNGTDEEYTAATSLDSFNSNGFTLGANTDGQTNVNISGGSYVAWTWDAGTSTVSNTSGSITTQVRANVSAGFSIVTYTGTGTAPSTFGHGLGVTPGFIIVKTRATADNWVVYHSSLGISKALILQTTGAEVTISNYWSPVNSTVFGQTLAGAGPNNGTQVAYCFAPVVGYSSMGSYVGNGSADGPFVYTGFRPRWVLFKNTNSGENWRIMDAARNTYNVANSILYPNLSNSEGSSAVGFDILSNGFKIRETGSELNASGVTIIYAAFAENPFQYARAR